MDAKFAYGEYSTANHTPVGALVAGQVVVTGDLALISHRDVDAGRLASLAAGRAVYKCVADAAIAQKKHVYWDDTAKKVSESTGAGANKSFGYTVTAAAANLDVIEVLHSPG